MSNSGVTAKATKKPKITHNPNCQATRIETTHVDAYPVARVDRCLDCAAQIALTSDGRTIPPHPAPGPLSAGTYRWDDAEGRWRPREPEEAFVETRQIPDDGSWPAHVPV